MINGLDNSKKIQLDIWVPEYNLALEYQGTLSSTHFFILIS